MAIADGTRSARSAERTLARFGVPSARPRNWHATPGALDGGVSRADAVDALPAAHAEAGRVPERARKFRRARVPDRPNARVGRQHGKVAPMSDTLELTKELIRRKSVTPDDAGCQELLIAAPRARGIHRRTACGSRTSTTSGRFTAAATGRSRASRATPTSCRRVRARNGCRTRSSPSSATASCTAAAPPT